MSKSQIISDSSEWTFELIETYEKTIGELADSYQLDTYPNQIELINSEQMMDAYTSIGMPINYNHWSFGKHFIGTEQSYRRGHMGLAYELVINSNPCISYLQEENTLTMQALVIAHACFGHNSFFKGNYLFKTWTDASSIVDYLLFSRNYISKCEERYGLEAVESILDACHALMNYGVDRYKRPYPLSLQEEKENQQQREIILQQQVNDLWRTIPQQNSGDEPEAQPTFPSEPQENLLYFFEKDAPLLEPWQREIIRIVRKMAQYLYPQRQTKVMNEGWACFWHYHLLYDLYHQGRVSEGFMLEFLQSHTSVVYQPPYDHPGFSGINPYTLGFSMMQDIRRICETPSDEDKHWFPDIAGSPWLETLHFAMENYKDESFILQFLSPKLIRDLKLFAVLDSDKNDYLEVAAIHNDSGYQIIREALAGMHNIGNSEPNIQIVNANLSGDRSLLLHHYVHDHRPMAAASTPEVLKHIHHLWSFDVKLESIDQDIVSKAYRWPPIKEKEEKAMTPTMAIMI